LEALAGSRAALAADLPPASGLPVLVKMGDADLTETMASRCRLRLAVQGSPIRRLGILG
jgi:hypothetical protein